ncbi:protein AIR1/2 [Cryptococcus gattii Ru294]|nr:protein AIR1/2 [Cryptococcus gattii Ru294]
MTHYVPTSFKPMRSLVAAAGIQLSPSSLSDQDEGAIEAEDGELVLGNIIIDEFPADGDIPALEGEHFQPPGLFSTSMMPKIVNTGGKLHVELKARDDEATVSEKDQGEGLMLPQHVLLETSSAVQDAEDGGDDGEGGDHSLGGDDFLEGLHFVDDDITRGSRRYFNPEPEDDLEVEATFLATADSRKVCQNCKRPGHQASKCPHIICTTCGAMDEHERRDCPLSKVCYGCGRRGHHKSECPDPISRNKRWAGCERCGGREHTDKNCPTLWRIYTYRSDSGRRDAIKLKEKAEGWVKEAIGGDAMEDWCYNCARTGHFGDDCPQRRGSLVRLTAPSAFSREIARRGPFFSAPKSSLPTPTHSRWEDDDPSVIPYTSAYDSFAGSNAGRRGREKEKQRMMARDSDFNDEDDWFSGERNRNIGKGAGTPRNNPRGGKGGKRPWDSEMRGREWDRDRYDRERASREFFDRDREPPRSRGQASSRRRSRSPNRRDGSRHNAMQEAAPNSAPPKAVYRPAVKMGDGAMDSPSVREGERGAKAGSKALVSRALSGQNSNNSTPRGRKSSNSPSALPSLLSRIESPTPSNSSSRRREGRGKEQERDWENEWRRRGNGGGKVASWGKDFDKEIEGLTTKRKTKEDGTSRGSSGQKYYGGYM